MLRHQEGFAAEQRACAFLQQHGLQLQEQRFRCDLGEIDLVMRDRQCWVFVEVKYRRSEDFASMVEHIRPQQCQRVRQAAQFYLLQHGLAEHRTQMRFDVVLVNGSADSIQWLNDAF